MTSRIQCTGTWISLLWVLFFTDSHKLFYFLHIFPSITLILPYSLCSYFLEGWARICKRFKEPRNRFLGWRAGTTNLFFVPARQATLAGGIDSSESMPGLLKRLQRRALIQKIKCIGPIVYILLYPPPPQPAQKCINMMYNVLRNRVQWFWLFSHFEV